jgi:hypothetical protein
MTQLRVASWAGLLPILGKSNYSLQDLRFRVFTPRNSQPFMKNPG